MSAGDWKDMFRAACEGDVELVRHHLQNGVDVDHAHPEFQSTPLVACILAQQEEVAHLLLDHGADPSLVSPFDGANPAQAARQAGLTAIEDRLRVAVDPLPVSHPVPAASARNRLRARRARRPADPG